MNKGFAIGWWQVAVSLVNQGVSSGSIVVAFSVLAVSLQAEFETSRAALMLTMTTVYLVNGIANPIVGAAMDRYSLRKILIGGAVCLAGGFFMLSFATSVIHVYLAYGVLLGLANAIVGPLSYTTLLPRWFVKKRARAVGITTLGYSVGGLVLPLLFHFLIETFGWRDAMRIFAAAMVVFVLPLIAFRIVDRPSDVGLYPDGDSAPPPAAATATAATAEQLPYMTILKNINFWAIAFTTGLVTAGAAGVLGNMAPLAISKDFTTAQGAIAVSVFSLGSFANKTLYALIGDRLKARVGLLTGLFLFMLSSFGFIHADTYPVLLAAAFLMGLAIGMMVPLWSYLTALAFGAAHVGRAFGLMTFIKLPMAFCAPPFLGWVYDRTGAYDNAFLVYIGLAFASALLVPLLRTGVPVTPTPRPAVS